MSDVRFYLKGHARSDIAQIRRYTIDTWGLVPWLIYKKSLFNKLQGLANNPNLGISINDISDGVYRLPLKDHVVYYLKRNNDVLFVGIISNSMSPESHLARKRDIKS